MKFPRPSRVVDDVYIYDGEFFRAVYDVAIRELPQFNVLPSLLKISADWACSGFFPLWCVMKTLCNITWKYNIINIRIYRSHGCEFKHHVELDGKIFKLTYCMFQKYKFMTNNVMCCGVEFYKNKLYIHKSVIVAIITRSIDIVDPYNQYIIYYHDMFVNISAKPYVVKLVNQCYKNMKLPLFWSYMFDGHPVFQIVRDVMFTTPKILNKYGRFNATTKCWEYVENFPVEYIELMTGINLNVRCVNVGCEKKFCMYVLSKYKNYMSSPTSELEYIKSFRYCHDMMKKFNIPSLSNEVNINKMFTYILTKENYVVDDIINMAKLYKEINMYASRGFKINFVEHACF